MPNTAVDGDLMIEIECVRCGAPHYKSHFALERHRCRCGETRFYAACSETASAEKGLGQGGCKAKDCEIEGSDLAQYYAHPGIAAGPVGWVGDGF